jgi:thiol-disulfide isomerase/thioredoxin
MTRFHVLIAASIMFFASTLPIYGSDPNGRQTTPSRPETKIVKDLYPNMELEFLKDAAVSDLPEGVLLRVDTVVIESKELNKTIADANEKMQPQLKKYASFLLEQIAIPKLLATEIKNDAVKNGKAITEPNEDKIIQDYVRTLAKTVKISESEIQKFYNENKDSLSGAKLEQVKPQIEQLLAQQKMQQLINELIKTIGRRMKIEVSASWLKTQAVLEQDNPVNKARNSGKPTLVDFGSKGCVPCDMLAPILETLKEKYKGKANVVVVLTGEEQVLAIRYGIEVIPLQIFYDKSGKEVFRHTGFFSQEEIEKQLSQMGVK